MAAEILGDRSLKGGGLGDRSLVAGGRGDLCIFSLGGGLGDSLGDCGCDGTSSTGGIG